MPLFLVFINVLFKLLSSHSDYDTCNLELSESNCLKCDILKQRTFLPIPSNCVCIIGWYNPGVE